MKDSTRVTVQRGHISESHLSFQKHQRYLQKPILDDSAMTIFLELAYDDYDVQYYSFYKRNSTKVLIHATGTTVFALFLAWKTVF
jgi:hypothetical protein